MSNVVECPTLNIECLRRMSNVQCQICNVFVEYLISDVEYLMFNVQCCISHVFVEYQISNVLFEYLMSNVEYLMFNVEYLMSSPSV